MTKQEMLDKAERNLRKAEIAFHNRFNHPKTPDQDKKNLADNVEYALRVRDMIAAQMKN